MSSADAPDIRMVTTAMPNMWADKSPRSYVGTSRLCVDRAVTSDVTSLCNRVSWLSSSARV